MVNIFIMNFFLNSSFALEQSNGVLYCTIPSSFHLAYLFAVFHEKQSNKCIESYSLSPPTLEQIFVRLTEEVEETLV